MVMNLMGMPTDLPLYDQQGNLISEPGFNMDLTVLDEQRDSTPEEKEMSDKLISIFREKLAEIDDIGTDLRVSEIVKVYDAYESEDDETLEYYTATVFGGKNGSGLWSNYLKTLSELTLRLESEFNDVWIRKFDIDSADDVFEVEVAVML